MKLEEKINLILRNLESLASENSHQNRLKGFEVEQGTFELLRVDSKQIEAQILYSKKPLHPKKPTFKIVTATYDIEKNINSPLIKIETYGA